MRRGPRVHFSFRSPFSWMAICRLLHRLPDAGERIEFIPFWDPDEQTSSALVARGAAFHYAQMSKAKHLYILHDTRRAAARLGLEMVWPIDDNPWWELPHLAFLQARRLGRAAQLYAAATAARWQRGENICDPAAIRRIGAEIGVDPDLLLAAPDAPDIRREAVDCLVTAYEDDIFGIPYFRVGRHRFWGLDRVDAFLDELSAPGDPQPGARPEPAGEAELARLRDLVGAFDTDTAGGCG